MRLTALIDAGGIVASSAAAVLWLLAAKYPIPDNIDTSYAAEQHAAALNSAGAWCQCFAAVFMAAQFWRALKMRH
jgi:hypothetical protein